jgi:hypothetical protein
MRSRSLIVWVAVLCPFLLPAADPIIARYSGVALNGGKFGYLAEVQSKLNALPADCRPIPALTVNGLFGSKMRDAIRKAVSCPGVQNSLPSDSEARNGALTDALWTILFPGRSKPSVYERAMVVVLTQEATDYDHAEWNFCQSRPFYDPAHGQSTCHSNDPTSFLTWGPRGATAGGGGEVQRILYAVDADPNMKAIVDSSFGSTSSDVRRLTGLDAKDVGAFLCKIWIDPQLRQQWKDGFARFGASPQVQRVYDALYASSSADGGKIAQYYRLYASAGIVPTEVDYAFMIDRATQFSGPGAKTIAAAAAAMKSSGARSTPVELRRWIALNFRPSNQRTDRLGRDVVFYVDGLEASGQGLTPEERTAWNGRNALRSRDAGLSESMQIAEFQAPQFAYPHQPRGTERLDGAERGSCPATVLQTFEAPTAHR